MTTPSVSVVIPFLNAARFLDDAIESVRRQTYKDWELILVDDGSEDASSRMAHTHAARDSRIVVLEHPAHENRGMSASRNLGLRHARGEFIALLDADDAWEPAKLEEQVAILRTNVTAGMVFGSPVYWRTWDGDANHADSTAATTIAADRLYQPIELAICCYPLGPEPAPCPSDLLIRRTVLQSVGGWDDRFRGMYEDQVLLMKIYLEADIYVSSRQWTRYRIHDAQTCAKVSQTEYWEIRRLFLDWLDTYMADRDMTDASLKSAVARSRFIAQQPPALRRIAQLRKALWRTIGRLFPARRRPRRPDVRADTG